jgi:hypothetical protein
MLKEEKNPALEEAVADTTALKALIVNYIGSSVEPENDEVTVEMAINVFAEEFPEFLMAIAEENYFRGYEQALVDSQVVNGEPTAD